MKSGSDYNVLAARRPVAVALRAILQDLASQGLIDRCRVVDLDSLTDDPTIPAILLDQHHSHGVALQQDIVESSPRGMRLAVVGVVDEEETTVSESQAVRVAMAMRETLPNAPMTSLSLSAGSPMSEWQRRSLVLLGWHNLALSPEESRAPGLPAREISRSLTDPKWYMLLAGTLTSLLGLWPGQTGSIFDQLQPPAGQLITPLRAFSRSLSSGSVQHALGLRLISVSERYPVPRVDSGYAIAVEDEVNRAVGMAERLLRKHPDMMPRVRHNTPAPQPKQIGAWEAVVSFLKFVVEALTRAPSQLLRAISDGASKMVARTVQSTVFGGSDSGYMVVVRGIRADGSSASWSEYESSLESVMRQARPESSELPAVPQKPAFWHDFVDAGMTLLDAGRRDSELVPWTQGSQRAVVVTTSRVSPDPRQSFTLATSLAAFLPNWEIQPGDDIAVARLLERLDYLAKTQHHLSQAISSERNRLRAWAESARNSYTGHVGRRLGEAHRDLLRELEELTEKVNRLSVAPPPSDNVEEMQDNLAMWVRVFTGVFLSAIAISVGLIVVGAIFWPLLFLLFPLFIIIWIISGTIVHARSSAKVYQILTKMERATTELEDAIRHRLEALEDLRRVSRSYRQYLDWSRAFGSFLQAPYGNTSEVAESEIYVGQGLPLNIGVGLARPDETAVDDVANKWRGQLFQAGWLSEPWQDFVTSLPDSLGSLRHHLSQDRNLLTQDPVFEGTPVLTRWSRCLAQFATERPMSDAISSKIVDLTHNDREARQRLLSRVAFRDVEYGQIRETDSAEFTAGLENASQLQDSFQMALFAHNADVIDIRSVKESLRQEEGKVLDVALVVVQLGQAVDVSQLAGEQKDSFSQGIISDGDFV